MDAKTLEHKNNFKMGYKLLFEHLYPNFDCFRAVYYTQLTISGYATLTILVFCGRVSHQSLIAHQASWAVRLPSLNAYDNLLSSTNVDAGSRILYTKAHKVVQLLGGINSLNRSDRSSLTDLNKLPDHTLLLRGLHIV